jgi:hypothetical protein
MIRIKMKNSLWVFVAVLLLPGALGAQKKDIARSKKEWAISMTADSWDAQPDKVEFVTYKNVPAIRIKENGGLSTLKNHDFTNGTIEFDAEPLDAAAAPFVTVYFRFQNNNESEVFYLRVGSEESHKRNDAVQYAPLIKGVNLWDMLPHYQGPAKLNNRGWNHIKLVISGKQMRAYVNDMTQPALEIPCLEANSSHGTIAFEGFAVFANLVIKPDMVEKLSPERGPDLTNHDANYLRHWFVTAPAPLDYGHELNSKDFPTQVTSWDTLHAERNGLINVTRKFGVENRRYVWLATNIKSSAQLQRKIELGFSDEVWVFVNRQMVYVDKNLYLQRMRKTPNGRCSIQNSNFTISLKPGDNEVLIGVANDFYGWGIIARLDDLEGVELLR